MTIALLRAPCGFSARWGVAGERPGLGQGLVAERIAHPPAVAATEDGRLAPGIRWAKRQSCSWAAGRASPK